MTSISPSDEPLTATDIRQVGFTQVKRGYDPEEVDALLEQVSASLETYARELAQRVAAAPRSDAPAVLHDPEGAAQRLLAAAQRTADSMTAEAEDYSRSVRAEADTFVAALRSEADTYAETKRSEANSYAASVRGDADEYAHQTRAEADAHAASVTGTAERQAEAIVSAAADEARRVAEDTRAHLVADLAGLQRSRDALQIDVDALRSHLEDQRERLLAGIDAMRSAIAEGDLTVLEGPPLAMHDPIPGLTAAMVGAESDDRAPSEGAFSVDEDDAGEAAAVDDQDDPDDQADGDLEDDATEPALDAAGEPPDLRLDEDDADAGVDAPAPTGGFGLFEAEADDAAPISVFDIQNGHHDHGDDTETGADGTGTADRVSAAAASIFDIEAEDDPYDVGPPTQALPVVGGQRPAGDRFFEELSLADDADDGLGPLDDDTDAALAAFFEPEDEDDLEERWRNRFGPRS